MQKVTSLAAGPSAQEIEDQRAALAARVEALVPRVEALHALGDMRDWCVEAGFVAAQHAAPAVVVRKVERYFRGGVDAFLIGY